MSTANLRILVVEGEASVAHAIAGILRRRGHHVDLAASAEEALGRFGADVLVSDLELPGSSGLELLEQLQRLGCEFRAVLLGTRPSLEDSRRALELGAVELLSKPFRMAELVRAVESAAIPPARAGRRAVPAFCRDYPSAAASVEQASRELAAFALGCGVSPAARARIASAAGEAIDNARRHGYCRGRGRIRVEAHVEDADVVVCVSDDGIGFDATLLDASGLHDTLRHGIARARALSEELEIESRPGHGTRVRLVFRASRVAFEDELAVDLSELDFLGPELARRVLHALRENPAQELFHLSPALAVVVGRLLAGPDPRPSIEKALWS